MVTSRADHDLAWPVHLAEKIDLEPRDDELGIDGYPLALAQTMAMNMLVVLEIFHLFFVRNIHGTSLTWDAIRGTKVVWTVVIIITAAQFAVTYLPPLQALLGTQPVSLTDGVLIVAVGAAFFALIEIEKQIRLGLTR